MPIGKWWRDISEGSIGLLRGHVQIENRPTTDQKSRVRSSLAMGARIVDDHLILKFRIMKFTIEHLTKSHEVTKIQRTKIKKEIPINELCVSREIMNWGWFGRFGSERGIEDSSLDERKGARGEVRARGYEMYVSREIREVGKGGDGWRV
jgi:hypothetical protein